MRQLYGLDETANIGFSETEIVDVENRLNIKFLKYFENTIWQLERTPT